VILLDTHALVWWISDPKRLPPPATRVIEKALRNEEVLGASSFSIWEITLLTVRGRLRLRTDFDLWIEKVEAIPLLAFYPVDNRIARRSATLALETPDPADRIIVATAIEHDATLVTGDDRIRAFAKIETVWD
jgi:PIN domain nuclease of toxin-antitoxin system